MIDTKDSVKVAKLATETGMWPLWDAVDSKITLSRIGRRFANPEKRKPVNEYFAIQGRYKGVDKDLLELAAGDIEYEWDWVNKFVE